MTANYDKEKYWNYTASIPIQITCLLYEELLVKKQELLVKKQELLVKKQEFPSSYFSPKILKSMQ
jgi:hypothetical protein